MGDSAAWFGLPFDRDAVRDAALDAVHHRDEPARVRVLLNTDGRPRIECTPLLPPPHRTVRLALDDEPVESGSFWLRHKATRREPCVTRALRHPEADDVVLVNEHGEVTETTIANIAIRLDERWWTPPTTAGCLPGVERARLLGLGRLHERRLTVDDLRAAEAIAVVSSLRGWRDAVLVDAGRARISRLSPRAQADGRKPG